MPSSNDIILNPIISEKSVRLKEQNKYSQHNDSWGRLVPIDVLIQEVGMLHFPLYNPAWQEKWNQLIEGIENASS